MATTWDALDKQLDYFLAEEKRTADKRQFNSRLRIHAWNWVQGVFSDHTARECLTTVTMEKGGREIALPSDFLQMSMLYDPSQEIFYSQAKFKYGGVRYDADEKYDYWEWGKVLHLGRTVGSAESLELYYYGSWPEVEFSDDGSNITVIRGDVLVPDWAMLALMNLTAAVCLDPHAVTSAMNREYNIKIDSGTPTENSRSSQAREFYWWYSNLMSLHAPQDRLGGIAR